MKGLFRMCDYSLHGLPNRLAVQGELLVSRRFSTGSMGLASVIDVSTATDLEAIAAKRRSWWSTMRHWVEPSPQQDEIPAVCIPTGARLLMSRIPETERLKYALKPEERVTFLQLHAETFQYRDAIRFTCGRLMGIQALREGIQFEVLSLGSGDREMESDAPEPRVIAWQ
jgi:hypothetical protein